MNDLAKAQELARKLVSELNNVGTNNLLFACQVQVLHDNAKALFYQIRENNKSFKGKAPYNK